MSDSDAPREQARREQETAAAAELAAAALPSVPDGAIVDAGSRAAPAGSAEEAFPLQYLKRLVHTAKGRQTPPLPADPEQLKTFRLLADFTRRLFERIRRYAPEVTEQCSAKGSAEFIFLDAVSRLVVGADVVCAVAWDDVNHSLLLATNDADTSVLRERTAALIRHLKTCATLEGNLTAMDASRLDFFLHAGKEQLCRDLRLTPAKTTEVLNSVFHEYVALMGNTEEGSSVQQHTAFLSQLSTVKNSGVNQKVLVRWCSRVFTDIVRAEQFIAHGYFGNTAAAQPAAAAAAAGGHAAGVAASRLNTMRQRLLDGFNAGSSFVEFVDGGLPQGVHAEMRVLKHWLLHHPSSPVPFIAVSKLCCAHCHVLLAAWQHGDLRLGANGGAQFDPTWLPTSHPPNALISGGTHACVYPWPLPSADPESDPHHLLRRFLGQELSGIFDQLRDRTVWKGLLYKWSPQQPPPTGRTSVSALSVARGIISGICILGDASQQALRTALGIDPQLGNFARGVNDTPMTGARVPIHHNPDNENFQMEADYNWTTENPVTITEGLEPTLAGMTIEMTGQPMVIFGMQGGVVVPRSILLASQEVRAQEAMTNLMARHQFNRQTNYGVALGVTYSSDDLVTWTTHAPDIALLGRRKHVISDVVQGPRLYFRYNGGQTTFWGRTIVLNGQPLDQKHEQTEILNKWWRAVYTGQASLNAVDNFSDTAFQLQNVFSIGPHV